MTAYEDRVAAIPETDIAWFAGWLCADGCITVDKVNGSPAVKFTICDIDPLERFVELFGNTVVGPLAPSGFGKLPRYHWKVAGIKAVVILHRCRPWLSSRYGERADRALTYTLREHLGRKLTPADVVHIRSELAVGGHGTARRLARHYDVSDGLIGAIKHERTWKTA